MPPPQTWPTQIGGSTAIIVQTDGGMVPIVVTDQLQADKRKGKNYNGTKPRYASPILKAARHWYLAARYKAAWTKRGNVCLIAR